MINMAELAYEGNTSLAFDTQVLKECAKKYGDIAEELRTMARKLDNCIFELKDTGWTTPAGDAFYLLTETNWEENIKKYADLLDTLQNILEQAADKYESLVINYVEKTKV